MRRLLLGVLALIGAQAQAPGPDAFAGMQEIAAALGVTCDYCHTAARGSGAPEPKKDIARAMIAMTRELNAKVEAATGKSGAAATRVQCVTCHRGVAVPQQLGDIIWQTLREHGVEPAIAEYRDLRQRYYGRQAYDFGEDTLLALAQRIVESRPGDAIALLRVNLEFNPRSARSYMLMAHAYTRKFDDNSAMASLEKALEIEPENGVARGQLEQLKSYHRK